MNLKTLGLTISLVSVGWLGVSEAASAAKFETGDTLSINLPSFQINAAGLPGVYNNLPPGQSNGGENGLADLLFGTFETHVPEFATDRVINRVGTTDDVLPNDLGEFSVSPSTGTFNNYRGQIGSIRSFDGSEFIDLNEVNGGFNPSVTDNDIANEAPDNPPLNYLLKLDAISSTNQEVFLYLTEVVSFDLPDALNNGGFAELIAKGWLIAVGDDQDIDYYSVDYRLSSQILADDGTGSDVVPGDGVSGAVSASAAALVIQVNREQSPTVPEPSAIIGLSVVAGAGLLMKKKKLVQNK